MAEHSDLQHVPAVRLDPVPGGLRAAAAAFTALGVLTLVVALATDADRAWRAYTFNWLYFTSVAMGAVMLAAVVALTKGLWSRPVRRFALSFVAFLPIAWLLLIPILLNASHYFNWLHGEDLGSRGIYLNLPFLVIRQLALLGALFGVALAFAYWSLRPDVGLLKERVPGYLRPLYDRLTRNWRGQEPEEALAHKRVAVLAPVLALVYAVAMSFVAFDFVMSLEADWFSTLIGGYFFMAAFLGGIAATAILTAAYARTLGLEGTILSSTYHDLGKLTFGFVVFWGYLFFAQYIVIWYGKLPVEQSFLVHRLAPPFRIVAIIVLAGIFIIPFFGLLGVSPKKHPPVLVLFTGVILLGLWLERYLLVYPSFYADAGNVPFGWQEIGMALGFLGVLLGCIAWFARRFPIFQLWQPMSELELRGLELTTEFPETSNVE